MYIYINNRRTHIYVHIYKKGQTRTWKLHNCMVANLYAPKRWSTLSRCFLKEIDFITLKVT